MGRFTSLVDNLLEDEEEEESSLFGPSPVAAATLEPPQPPGRFTSLVDTLLTEEPEPYAATEPLFPEPPPEPERTTFTERLSGRYARGLEAGELVAADAFNASIGLHSWDSVLARRAKLRREAKARPLKSTETGIVGAIEDAVLSAAEIAGPISMGLAQAGAMAGAGGAVAGPPGAVAGAAFGTVQYWYRLGVGTMASEMIEKDIEPWLASSIAIGLGYPYAMIERSQVAKIVPIGRKKVAQAIGQSAKKAAAMTAARYGAQAGVEVGEEIAQEAVQIAAEESGKALSNLIYDTDLEHTDLAESIERAGRIAKEAGPGLAVLLLAGSLPGGISAQIDVRKRDKAIKAVRKGLQGLEPEQQDELLGTFPAEVQREIAGRVVEEGETASPEPLTGKERRALVDKIKEAGHVASQWLSENFPDTKPSQLTKMHYAEALGLLKKQATRPPDEGAEAREGAGSEDTTKSTGAQQRQEESAEERIAATVDDNEQRIEVRFEDGSRGPESAQEKLKAEKFRFGKARQAWYASLRGKNVTESMRQRRKTVAAELGKTRESQAVEAERKQSAAPVPRRAPRETVQVEPARTAEDEFPSPTRRTPDTDELLPTQMPMRLDAPRGERAAAARRGRGKATPPRIIHQAEKVVESLGGAVPIRTGRMKRGQEGVYKVHPAVVRLRRANDIPVALHEIAHAIDHIVKLQKGTKLALLPESASLELVTLGKQIYKKRPHNGWQSEGFAQFLKLWASHDGDAQSQAPEFSKWFDTELRGKYPATAKELDVLRDMVREYRGVGSTERIARHIAKSSAVEKAREVSDVGFRKVLGILKDKAVTNWSSMAHPLDQLARAAEESMGRSLSIEEDPGRISRALAGTHDKRVESWVRGDGMTDWTGANVVGPALEQALSPVKGQYESFQKYLIARRVRALANDPEGARETGITADDAEQAIRDLETPEMQEAAHAWYDWHDGVLNYAAQHSPVFAQVVEKMRARDPGDYAPLAREFGLFEALYRRKGGGKSSQGMPGGRLKGSGRRIMNPIPVAIANARAMVLASHKRFIADQIIKLAQLPEMGDLIEEVPRQQVPKAAVELKEVLDRLQRDFGISVEDTGDLDLSDAMLTFYGVMDAPKGKDPVIAAWSADGVKWYYVKDHGLFEALGAQETNRDVSRVADLLFGAPARVFRVGTTGLNPSFSLVTNLIRDLPTGILNSRADASAPRFFFSWLASLKDGVMAKTQMDAALKKAGVKSVSDYYQTWRRMGGEMAQPLGQDVAHTKRAARMLFESKGMRVLDVRNALDLFRELIQFPESAPRVAEFRQKAREIGWDGSRPITQAEALELAEVAKPITVDFIDVGKIARDVNRAIPFFTAAVGGVRRAVQVGREDPRRVAVRSLSMLTVPTLLLWLKVKDEEWYKEMPWRERLMNWHVPLEFEGKKELTRIPRPFEYGTYFSALPEALLDAWYRHDPKAVKEWAVLALETTIPPGLSLTKPAQGGPLPGGRSVVVEAPLLQTYMEQQANWQSFWEQPIVKRSLQDVPVEQQYSDYTTRAAIVIGKAIGVSPARIDHMVQGIFGGVARDVLSIGGMGKADREFEEELADLPVVGRLFMRGGQTPRRPISVDSLYELADHHRIRQNDSENPETEDERDIRLMLGDATRALSAMYAVRRSVSTREGRASISEEILALSKDAVAEARSVRIDRLKFAAARRKAEDEKAVATTGSLGKDDRRSAIVHHLARWRMAAKGSETRKKAEVALDTLGEPVGGWKSYFEEDKKDLERSIRAHMSNRLREIADVRGQINSLRDTPRKEAIDALNEVAEPYGGWPSIWRRFRTHPDWRLKQSDRKRGRVAGEPLIEVWTREAERKHGAGRRVAAAYTGG